MNTGSRDEMQLLAHIGQIAQHLNRIANSLEALVASDRARAAVARGFEDLERSVKEEGDGDRTPGPGGA